MSSTPKDIAAALGRETIQRKLKVGQSAVSMAIHRGAFPAAWFDGIEALCHEAGIDCPRSLFAFRAYASNGNAPAPRQGKGAA